MAAADRPVTAVEAIEHLLEAQRDALVARDPAALERANAALAVGLDALRRTAPASHDASVALRGRAVLRAQAELIARGQAATERALAVLVPQTETAYATRGTARPRAGQRHVIA